MYMDHAAPRRGRYRGDATSRGELLQLQRRLREEAAAAAGRRAGKRKMAERRQGRRRRRRPGA